MHNIISSIICDEFDNKVKRWQSKNEKHIAMKLTFSLQNNNHDIEEGYRHLDILIYGHNNYIAVMVKERWNIIPIWDINFDKNGSLDKDGLPVVKKEYRKGDTGWKLACYHDSRWRDSVQKVVYNNSYRISIIDCLFDGWYQKVDMTPELMEIYRKLTPISNKEDCYIAGKDVLNFKSNGTECFGIHIDGI